jgi:phospholipid/cholesterol/gamma-HCH transport system ATP-binding protein
MSESNLLDVDQSMFQSKKTILSIKNVYKSFGNNKVLIDFNLELLKGENVVVLGKSGSGKSVLIKCIIGLLAPEAGKIKIFENNITDISNDELDKIRTKVGFLFQSNALYDSMTVRENLEFPLRRHRVSITQKQVNSMVEEALNEVGLAQAIDSMPAELSGGMRKRIALARTLILKPEIILYDEPTTGLDPITAKEIINLMIKIRERYSTTSLIISHDMYCVRMASSRVVMLLDGRCYANGTYDQLAKEADCKVKQFFE